MLAAVVAEAFFKPVVDLAAHLAPRAQGVMQMIRQAQDLFVGHIFRGVADLLAEQIELGLAQAWRVIVQRVLHASVLLSSPGSPPNRSHQWLCAAICSRAR